MSGHRETGRAVLVAGALLLALAAWALLDPPTENVPEITRRDAAGRQ